MVESMSDAEFKLTKRPCVSCADEIKALKDERDQLLAGIRKLSSALGSANSRVGRLQGEVNRLTAENNKLILEIMSAAEEAAGESI